MKNSQDQKNLSRKSQDPTREVSISADDDEIASNAQQDSWDQKGTSILPTQLIP